MYSHIQRDGAKPAQKRITPNCGDVDAGGPEKLDDVRRQGSRVQSHTTGVRESIPIWLPVKFPNAWEGIARAHTSSKCCPHLSVHRLNGIAESRTSASKESRFQRHSDSGFLFVLKWIGDFALCTPHHEPLIGRDSLADFSNLMVLLEWICPAKEEWIRPHCRVPQIVRERP
jgi:hypothetical protein